ncbi:TRAP transporter small permease [Sporosarcina sp. P29]|uniref:TRAP transporter small permease n=1 Tax=Sporosarcina sp. P29 TaxID=2048252 RepID=UPI000C1665CB|nr:TRAP transporter small permease subunit [Sporosarcina sp. P29]PIC99040.1 C4-dicarboxylate ABC transporter permease [Sporosarcina sp. P29]
MRNEQIIEFDIESASFPRDIPQEKVVNTSNLFIKTTDYLNRFLAVVAGIALISMMLLIVFNSIKRMYSDPIAGTVEIVSWLGAITGIFALGYTQLNKGHVYIDMLLDKFPFILQKVIHTFMNVISTSFFLVAAWQLLLFGINLRGNGVVSQTIQFSFYPIVILSSIGFIGLVLAIVKETILLWKEAS